MARSTRAFFDILGFFSGKMFLMCKFHAVEAVVDDSSLVQLGLLQTDRYLLEDSLQHLVSNRLRLSAWFIANVVK